MISRESINNSKAFVPFGIELPISKTIQSWWIHVTKYTTVDKNKKTCYLTDNCKLCYACQSCKSKQKQVDLRPERHVLRGFHIPINIYLWSSDLSSRFKLHKTLDLVINPYRYGLIGHLIGKGALLMLKHPFPVLSILVPLVGWQVEKKATNGDLVAAYKWYHTHLSWHFTLLQPWLSISNSKTS